MSTINTNIEDVTNGRYPENSAHQYLMDNIDAPGVKEFRIKHNETGEVLAKTVVGDGTSLDIEHVTSGLYTVQWKDESGNKYKVTYDVEADTWIRWTSIRAQGGYCFSLLYDLEQYPSWTDPDAPEPEPVECPTCGQIIH